MRQMFDERLFGEAMLPTSKFGNDILSVYSLLMFISF